MDAARIGSLFSGTGALDLAVQEVFGGKVVWHSQYEPPHKKTGREDTNQYAARILARHWPTVPNLGDITAACWGCVLDEHGPIEILAGGFPCTDVSSAGQRAGLLEGTRSGLWNHMARAISVLRPRLVVIENVEGLLSAPADRGLELDDEALDEEARAGRVLRALGAVLGDLATLGFDAEWVRVAASEVGAAHLRKRVFVVAWPAAADSADLGHERGRGAWRRGDRPADRGLATAHTCGRRLEIRGVEPDRHERAAAERGSGEPPADAHRCGLPGHGELPAGRDTLRGGVRPDSDRRHPATANSQGNPGRLGDGDDVRAGGSPDGREPTAGRGAAPDADDFRRRADVLDLRPGKPDVNWGDCGPAIRRHERVFGRPAPWPTDALGRLSPVFTEWLMGLPDGWVTCTPGLNRNAMLKALGNGVVPLQAVAALRLLAARIGWELAA